MNKEEINKINDRIIGILGELIDLHEKNKNLGLKNQVEAVRMAKTLIQYSQRDRDSEEGLSNEDIQRQYQLLGDFYHLVEQDSKDISSIAFEAKLAESISKEVENVRNLRLTPDVNKKVGLSKFKISFKKEIEKKQNSTPINDLSNEVRIKSFIAKKMVEALNATDINKVKTTPFESGVNQVYKAAIEERVDPSNTQRLQILVNNILANYYLDREKPSS